MNEDSPSNIQVNEFQASYTPEHTKPVGFIHESEDDRLLRDINRPPLEKLMLFTQMIRRERMFKQALNNK